MLGKPKDHPLLHKSVAWRDADHATETTGLTSGQAQLRLKQFGPNRLKPPAPTPWLFQYLAHFKNPLVLILLIASGVSAAVGELSNFFIIAAIVLLSVTLDFIQEFRAHLVTEKLRQSVAVQACVIRDGHPCKRPVAEIVRGDLVCMSAGDLVPADGWILQARDFFVNEALLTGESFPVEKFSQRLPAQSQDTEATSHVVFMGTSVISGSAKMLVARTGDQTAIGEISDLVMNTDTPSSFEVGIRHFGLMILRLTLLMVMFVFLVNIISYQQPWLTTFLFAVALAVGLTPELLPMVISVTLARGAMAMAAKQMVVKRPASIQDLGSMDILCTDKTGTLTEAHIQLSACVDLQNQPSDWALRLAGLNSHFETGLKSPLDDAILEHQAIDTQGWSKVDEVPFDFERRRVSVLLAHETSHWLITKGAPDDILPLCVEFVTNDPKVLLPLDEVTLATTKRTCQNFESEGLRVLAIAYRHLDTDHQHIEIKDESKLIFAGFVAFMDPPKQSAGECLRALEQLGIQIKIITGDSSLVTQHICRQLGIPVRGLLTGADIASLDDMALNAKAEQVNLFCRMNPAQKNRVLHALKNRGHVVGYLGDGVNDVPALHTADVGLSVDSAVDVAKAAADMIMLKHDLSVLHDAVLEGRRTFGNIMKYILMSTSSNFGNMFSMAVAVTFLPFLPMLPTQILLNNILYDLSEVTIPFDAVDPTELQYPQEMDMPLIRHFMFTLGPVSSLFDFLTFYMMLALFQADEHLFQTGWFVESLCTQVLVIFVIRTRDKCWLSKPHPWLMATSLGIVSIALVLPLSPVAPYFGFTPPPLTFYGALLLMVLTYLGLVELIKLRFFRIHSRLSLKGR